MESYATVDDMISLWRPLTDAESNRVTDLLPMVSDMLREAAHNVGKDLDEMILKRPSLASVAKTVTVDVASRILRQATNGEPVSQESQSALGYSWQGTYAIPGGGMTNAIMNSELKRLGLYRQRIGVIECDTRHYNSARDKKRNWY